MKQQDQGQAARPRKSREEVERCIASLVDEIARLLAKVDALSREEIAIGLEVLAERDHGGRHARTERYCARGYRPDVPPISCRNLDSTGQQMSARVGKTKRVT